MAARVLAETAPGLRAAHAGPPARAMAPHFEQVDGDTLAAARWPRWPPRPVGDVAPGTAAVLAPASLVASSPSPSTPPGCTPSTPAATASGPP